MLVPQAPIVHNDRDLLAATVGAVKAGIAALPIIEMPNGMLLYYMPDAKEVFMDMIPGREVENDPAAEGNEDDDLADVEALSP